MISLKEQNKQCRELGKVFNIQRFSVNDGPGIRTIVFFKGCPLRCKWCSNPESQEQYFQLMFNEKSCVHCGKCEKVCGEKAINLKNPNRIDRELCIDCGKCAEICYVGALSMAGKYMDAKEAVEVVKKDINHFNRSGGGITLSGGEPLMQWRFAKDLLIEAKRSGINTAMETTGYTNERVIYEVMPLVDYVLLDIKSINEKKHLDYIGVGNKVILNNAKIISEICENVIIRVPIIPNFNDDIESIREIATFAKGLKNIREIHLLPYHKMGVNKYECIGKKYGIEEGIVPPSKDLMESLKNTVLDVGIGCNLGAI